MILFKKFYYQLIFSYYSQLVLCIFRHDHIHIHCCSCVLPFVAGFTRMHICELRVTFASLTHTRSQPYAYAYFYQKLTAMTPCSGKHNLTSVRMYVIVPHLPNRLLIVICYSQLYYGVFRHAHTPIHCPYNKLYMK